MHFELLCEDKSGAAALEIFVPKIIKKESTYKIYPHHGLGNIPEKLTDVKGLKYKQLLSELPKRLRAYEKTYTADDKIAILIICDLDDKDETTLYNLLDSVRKEHSKNLQVHFCFAIEESEAWLLGDKDAVKKAYPNCKHDILKTYVFDSICGTWEKLADSIYPGGSKKLKQKEYREIGEIKQGWAKKIAPHVNVETNESPSFRKFYQTIQTLEEENNTD